MSSHRSEGVRPFRARMRFPRRMNYNRGYNHNNRGGYHNKDYHHKGDYYKGEYHHKESHRYHHDSQQHEKYERHYSGKRRYSKSKSRSRSRSPSGKSYIKKRRRSRSYSRSRSHSNSRSRSRSRSVSRSKYRRSRSRSRSSSSSSSYHRPISTADEKKTESPVSTANKESESIKSAGPEKLAGTFRPLSSQKPEVRAVKDMPLYSDEELELPSGISKKDSVNFKISLKEDLSTSLLERAMIEKKKLGLVNPGASEKSSALEALQCYSPEAHLPSPFSDHGREKMEAFVKERQARALERQGKPLKSSFKNIADQKVEKVNLRSDSFSPPSPVRNQVSRKPDLHSVIPNIPGLGFSSVDEEDEFLYGRGTEEKKTGKPGNDINSENKGWMHLDQEKSSNWSDEEERYDTTRGRHVQRISRTPSPTRVSQGKVKAKMFDLGELFTPALKSKSVDDVKESVIRMDILEDMPLMINSSNSDERKAKSELGKKFSIWDTPDHDDSPVKKERTSPIVKRIVSEAPLSPFRSRQGNWRPESQVPISNKNMSNSESSIPLSIDLKRTIRLGASPLSERSKRSDSYHSIEHREQKRPKTQSGEPGKSQQKLTDVSDSSKSAKDKTRGEHGKHYDSWENSPQERVSEDRRESFDKEHRPRERKPSRPYSQEHSPGYDPRHRSPYRSPSYSPYGYSPRRRSPYRGSPRRGNYYSPYRSPERGYDRSPSPGYYNRRERYRSPGHRGSSYSPQRGRVPYDKFSRSPSHRREPIMNALPDIPLPQQPPPQSHFPQPPYYDPNSAPPSQYPAPPQPYPPGPVGYPIIHPPPPFHGQYPPNMAQGPYSYPPPPVGTPLSYPPPISNERANLKVIPLQQNDPSQMASEVKQLSETEKQHYLKDKEEKCKQYQSLRTELEQLQKLQGEMMRKKQRQKDGHKDPLILENTKLQEEIKNQVKQMEESVKGICVILGESAPNFDTFKTEQGTLKKEDNKEEAIKEEDKEISVQFEYFDPGNHWCKMCNQFLSNSSKFLLHLQSQEHLKRLDPKYRPWSRADINKSPAVSKTGKPPVLTPLKGPHFLTPISGFYCSLCENLMGDIASAEEHLRTQEHNRNYTKHTLLNPKAEKNRNKEKNQCFIELKKEEKRKFEMECMKELAKKKKKDAESERKHKELIKSEKEKSKGNELEDHVQSHSRHNRQSGKTSTEKTNIKLTLLSEKEESEKKKKPAPVVLIGKAPNFKPRDDIFVKGVGISKLQGWKKGDNKKDDDKKDDGNFPLRKTRNELLKEKRQNEFDKLNPSNSITPTSEISTGDIANAFAGSTQSSDSSLIHGPRLPPESEDYLSENSKALPPISWEEQNDLQMLGIDREDFVMIAAPRAPPVTSFTGNVAIGKALFKPKTLVSKDKHSANIPKLDNLEIDKVSETEALGKKSEKLESNDPIDMDIDGQSDADKTANLVSSNKINPGQKLPEKSSNIESSKSTSSNFQSSERIDSPFDCENISLPPDSCPSPKMITASLKEVDPTESVFQHFNIIEQIGKSIASENSSDSHDDCASSPGNLKSSDFEAVQEGENSMLEETQDSIEDDMKLMLEDDEPDENNDTVG